MGLYEYIMSNPYDSNSNKAFYDNPITGTNFSILNSFKPIADNDEIWNYQRQELNNLQQAVIKDKHAQLNAMILSGEMNKGPSEYQAQQDQKMDEVMHNVYSAIDNIRALYTKAGSIEAGKDKLRQRNSLLRQLKDALEDVKKKANIDSPIYEADLQRVEGLIRAIDSTGTARGWSNFIKNINQFQGEILEEIGVSWFNQRIPRDMKMKAVSTGKVYYSGGSHGEKGQLIQDMLVVNMNAPDILNDAQISFSINDAKGKPQSKTMSLAQFFEFLKKYSGSEQIKIDDEAYEMLLSASALGVQAKSGKNQLPWNKNKSNKISIADFGDDDHTPSVKRAFLLIQELSQLTSAVQTKSDQYNLMANYGLATCFAKFLHMGDLGNQYLLTRDGFVTYYDRIMDMHDKYGSIFTISGKGITLDENTVTDKHNVSFYNGY